MTNNIKTFCVDMTNKSDEQIKWLHAKCLEVGAFNYDTVDYWLSEKNTQPLMGIDLEGDTLSRSIESVEFHFDGVIIPLGQVEEHLGLTPEKVYTIEVGTLEHAYEVLEGDLSNCNLFCNKASYKYLVWCYPKMYYLCFSEEPDDTPSWKEVCTVQQFQEYSAKRKINSSVKAPLGSVNLSKDESPSEEIDPVTKPVKWTQEMSDRGVELEVGMIALLGYNSSKVGKEVQINYIGKMYVTYTPSDDLEDEGSCYPEALSPFPNEPTPEELHRDKVCKIIRSSSDVDVVYDKLIEADLLK